MSEMLEQVADGLIAKFKAEVALSAGVPFEQTKVSVPDRSIWIGYARAAIEAMREPTDDMLNADSLAAADTYWLRAGWQAMVDEALK